MHGTHECKGSEAIHVKLLVKLVPLRQKGHIKIESSSQQSVGQFAPTIMDSSCQVGTSAVKKESWW